MKKLYTYTKQTTTEDLLFLVKIDANHPIFGGHFPGNPILPGVCQMQMVKDIFKSEFPEYSCVVSSKAIKFLHIINPRDVDTFQLKISSDKRGDDFKLSASIYDENHTYLKMDMQIAKEYAN